MGEKRCLRPSSSVGATSGRPFFYGCLLACVSSLLCVEKLRGLSHLFSKKMIFFSVAWIISNWCSSNCTTAIFTPVSAHDSFQIPSFAGVRQRGDKYSHINKEEKASENSAFRCFFVIFLSESLIFFYQSPRWGENRKIWGLKVCLVLNQEIFLKPLKNLRHFDIIHGE